MRFLLHQNLPPSQQWNDGGQTRAGRDNAEGERVKRRGRQKQMWRKGEETSRAARKGLSPTPPPQPRSRPAGRRRRLRMEVGKCETRLSCRWDQKGVGLRFLRVHLRFSFGLFAPRQSSVIVELSQHLYGSLESPSHPVRLCLANSFLSFFFVTSPASTTPPDFTLIINSVTLASCLT